MKQHAAADIIQNACTIHWLALPAVHQVLSYTTLNWWQLWVSRVIPAAQCVPILPSKRSKYTDEAHGSCTYCCGGGGALCSVTLSVNTGQNDNIVSVSRGLAKTAKGPLAIIVPEVRKLNFSLQIPSFRGRGCRLTFYLKFNLRFVKSQARIQENNSKGLDGCSNSKRPTSYSSGLSQPFSSFLRSICKMLRWQTVSVRDCKRDVYGIRHMTPQWGTRRTAKGVGRMMY